MRPAGTARLPHPAFEFSRPQFPAEHGFQAFTLTARSFLVTFKYEQQAEAALFALKRLEGRLAGPQLATQWSISTSTIRPVSSQLKELPHALRGRGNLALEQVFQLRWNGVKINIQFSNRQARQQITWASVQDKRALNPVTWL